MALGDRCGELSIGESLALSATEHPERPFVIGSERRLSYGEVNREAERLATALFGLGIESGDRIGLSLPNWPEFVVAMFAAAKLGAVIVPLNPRFTAHELQYMLRHSEASVVITAETVNGVECLPRFEVLFGALPDLQYVVSVGDDDLWYDDRIFQWDQLLETATGASFTDPEVSPTEDLFAILYTSGTTGKPKGVALTHHNLMCTAIETATALGLGADDVVFGLNALFNVFGLGPGVLGTMAAGAALVLQEDQDAGRALEVLERERVTVHHGVPTSFVRELHEPSLAGRDLSSLRTGVVAGAPVPEELITRIQQELVPDLRVAYGLTETGSTVSITRSGDSRAKRWGTVGMPLPGTEVRVLDVDGSELPVESIGELAVRGPGIMCGYYRQPGETARAMTPDRFFRTGDLGMVDDEGYLHIIGRRKELIIRGGFNVYPREVEDRLHAHPAVLDVAVVGIPDPVFGERACACIVPVEGAIVTGEEIKQFCSETMADYKVPDLVRFLDGFPLTGSGKVRRIELARIINVEEQGRRP